MCTKLIICFRGINLIIYQSNIVIGIRDTNLTIYIRGINLITFTRCIKFIIRIRGGDASWSWSYGSWIKNYQCNQCLSPITLWVRFPFDTTLCDKVCQRLAAGQWFSPVSSTNNTDSHDTTDKKLLKSWKEALNTTT